MAENSGKDIVVDVGKWEWSELWRKEDWWAIWLGFIILFAGMFIYFPHSGDMKAKIDEAEAKYGTAATRTSAIKTIAWYQLEDAKKKVKATDIDAGKWMKNFAKKPHGWSNNPLQAFMMDEGTAAAKKEKAEVKYEKKKATEKETFAAAEMAEAAAEAAGFKNESLNAAAAVAISEWRDAKLFAGKAKAKTKAKAYNQIGWLILLGVSFAFFFGIPMVFMGVPLKKFLVGFIFVFGVTVVAWLFSSQSTMKQLRHRLCLLGHLYRDANQQHGRHPEMGHAGSSDRILYQDRSCSAGRQDFI